MMKVAREDWGTYYGAKYRVAFWMYSADRTQHKFCHWYFRSKANSQSLFLKMAAAVCFESDYKKQYDWVDHVVFSYSGLARGKARWWNPDSDLVWTPQTLTDQERYTEIANKFVTGWDSEHYDYRVNRPGSVPVVPVPDVPLKLTEPQENVSGYFKVLQTNRSRS